MTLKYGPDISGPGLLSSAADEDAAILVREELRIDGDPDLATTGVRLSGTLLGVVLLDDEYQYIYDAGYDADGRRIYRINGYLNDDSNEREYGARVLRSRYQSNLVVRHPRFEEGDLAGISSCVDDLVDEGGRMRYETNLVIVYVR